MTQKEIDTIFSITITIHENKFFGEGKRIDREIVQEWTARQLAIMHEIYTIPCGSSWGVIVSEETYNNYWKENTKL